jgi:hypothetical protein
MVVFHVGWLLVSGFFRLVLSLACACARGMIARVSS